MKKQMYGIIGLSAAVVVLGGGLIALNIADKSVNEDKNPVVEQTTENTGRGFIIVDDSSAPYIPDAGVTAKGKVKSVKVTNGDIVLDAIISKEASEGSYSEYTLRGYEDLSVDSLLVSTLFNNAFGLTSESIIEENCTDFDKFGLADTAVSVEVTFESGNTKKLLVGDSSPVTSNVYVRLDGSDTVYDVISSKMANYKEPVSHFIDKTVVAKLDETADIKINSLEIVRKDLKDEFLIEFNPDKEKDDYRGSSSEYLMKKPVETFIEVEAGDAAMKGLFGLTANDISVLHCTDADIAKAGLDDAFCKASVKASNGDAHTLLLSETFKDEDGTELCYGMIEGGKVIYTFVPASVTWLTLTPQSIASQNTIVSFVWNISNLEVNCGDTTEVFTIEPKESGADRTKAKKENMNVTRNGKSFDAERYRQFYAFLTAAPAEELAYEEPVPSGKPVVTLKYSDAVSGDSFTYEFYDHSAMKSLIVINGKSMFTCSKSYVNTLADNIGRIKSGMAFETKWSGQ